MYNTSHKEAAKIGATFPSNNLKFALLLTFIQASDRLKTDEELAVEEKERLEKLEVDMITSFMVIIMVIIINSESVNKCYHTGILKIHLEQGIWRSQIGHYYL